MKFQYLFVALIVLKSSMLYSQTCSFNFKADLDGSPEEIIESIIGKWNYNYTCDKDVSGNYDTTFSSDNIYILIEKRDSSLIDLKMTINFFRNDSLLVTELVQYNANNHFIALHEELPFPLNRHDRALISLTKSDLLFTGNCAICYDHDFFIRDLNTSSPDLNQEELEIALFPNPNNGSFTISIPYYFMNNTILVYNVVGELIDQIKVTNVAMNIDLSLSSGIYYLNILDPNNDKNWSEKILIQ